MVVFARIEKDIKPDNSEIKEGENMLFFNADMMVKET